MMVWALNSICFGVSARTSETCPPPPGIVQNRAKRPNLTRNAASRINKGLALIGG